MKPGNYATEINVALRREIEAVSATSLLLGVAYTALATIAYVLAVATKLLPVVLVPLRDEENQLNYETLKEGWSRIPGVAGVIPS